MITCLYFSVYSLKKKFQATFILRASLFHVQLNRKNSDLAFGIQRCTCIFFKAEFAAEGLRGSTIFSLTFLWTVDASAGSLSSVWANHGLVCGFLTFSLPFPSGV